MVRRSFVAGRTTSRLPTTSRKLRNGLDHQAFWIAVKAICRKDDISTAKCLRKYRFGNTIGVHESCTLARFQDTAPMSLLCGTGTVSTWLQPALPGRRRMGGGFRPLRTSADQAAGTSSGRLWSATAFTAVAARSRLRPRPRTRTISNLSTALPTSTWRTTWTTSRRFVCVVISSKLRGNHECRIIWKAGCLETCTSGLGLGPGCNSPAYTTSGAPMARQAPGGFCHPGAVFLNPIGHRTHA